MTNHIRSTFRRLFSLAVFVCLNSWLVPAFPLDVDSSHEPLSAQQEEDINRFVDTISVIKKEYAKPINEKKLLENAIRGMVGNLDPHSEYLDEDAYKALLVTTNGEFGGIGIEVTTEFGVLKVVTPIDDTPAFKAGIKSGDYIVALNNIPINQMTTDEAVDQMRGKQGTKLLLTVIRKGVTDPMKFNLIRDIIHIDSIKSKMLDDNYGYIRLSQFQEPTTNLLITAITNLKKQAGGHLNGLILDLRNNPGGLLETAVTVADVFLDSEKIKDFNKLIVYTEGRVPEAEYRAISKGHDLLDAAPLIVLINEGSASASEIVAGALQDYRRAMIVGTTSFGKGSVQTVLPLDHTHAIKLTTALYHTPSGRIIQNQGIIPDIYVPEYKVGKEDSTADIEPIREMQLKDHLANISLDGKNVAVQPTLASLAHDDFQLYESLNILKTMRMLNSKP